MDIRQSLKISEAQFWGLAHRGAEDECWPWRKPTGKGYGQFRNRGPILMAHRVAYELAGKSIPEGFQLDHLCRNRACVNPAHLEPVTRRENILRGNSPHAINSRKTHCAHGHLFAPENIYFDRRGWRQCRACRANHRSAA